MHRHSYQGRKFSRERDQRRALLKSLANSLVLFETMTTTVAKAKEVAPYVEKLVSFAKTGTLADRRVLRSRLTTDQAVKKLVEELAPAWKERQGGYTRVIKAGNRGGDNAPVAVVSLVLPEGLKPAPEAAKAEAKAAAPKKATTAKPKAKKAAAKPKAKAGAK
jgi:large subunit ribosomal protein L17